MTMMAGGLLAVFGCLMLAVQIGDFHGQSLGLGSVIGSGLRGEGLSWISDIVQRDSQLNTTAGTDRQLDMELPEDARGFIKGMTASTNGARAGAYYILTYYLFPREVAVTLDQPRFTPNGIQGRSSDSDQEIVANGFNARIDPAEGSLQTFNNIPQRTPTNPAWFDSAFDASVAFLLPLLTALSGVWLLRLLFGSLSRRLTLAEQLACGLGLGMMMVAALTLGVKLCGCHGRGWVLSLTATGALAELWRDRTTFLNEITRGFWKTVFNPVTAVMVGIVLIVFFILFRLAALQGIVEFDAVAAWLLKAKILYLSTGNDLVAWFSNPRLAYAHLDYPVLVPCLHATTYDSIGHVDEFVTKFWPAWMLLFLLMALASLSRSEKGWFHAPHFFLLGVLLLPFTQTYVQMEGGTLPMVFFTVMGFVQCVLGLVEKDHARLGLGMTLLFGAAMTKFEGMIFLALTASWLLLLPWAHPSPKTLPQFWRAAVFCLLAALPFVCLRAQIPSLHFESGWAGYALAHPGVTLASAPKVLLILLAREFFSPDFAQWNATDGQLHWNGHWVGFSSLFNHLTFGLAWVCLLLTILLWMAAPGRRKAVVWTLAVWMSAQFAFSVVFASFISVGGLNDVIASRIADNASGRYLFPMLLAWGATMVILFFADFSPPASVLNKSPTTSTSPSSATEKEAPPPQ